jgi:hypothetical protein
LTDITAATLDKTPSWGRGASAFLFLIALLVVADLLFWRVVVVTPGISVAMFFAALALPVIWLRRGALNNRMLLAGCAIFALSLLPLIEAVSLTGFFCALGGVSVLALAASKRLPRAFEDVTGVLIRFGVLAPFRLLGDSLGLVLMGSGKSIGGRIVRAAITWVVPAGFALAFLLLFSQANPLIETALSALKVESAFELLHPLRIGLWVVVAVIAWPLLRPKLLPWPKAVEVQGPVLPRAESLIFGRSAILRSLVLFNALFAVQTVLDCIYLWGGIRLPDGLSYADYAHRGAYPLIVTALLAGAFVLAAMRKSGPAESSPLIRRLVYLWIAQNVLLVVSSILRLDLYVQVYSLTEMRIAAGIWMGLVAVGLLLILVKILRRYSNRWLVSSNLVALGVTLWGCSFVDFSAVIAQFNIENSRELGGKGQPLDLHYLGDLGPSAIPAITWYLDHAEGPATDFDLLAGNMAADFLNQPRDWLSWTFRDQRLRDWLAANPRYASFSTGDRTGVTSP